VIKAVLVEELAARFMMPKREAACLDAGDVIDIGSGSAHAFLRTVIFSCAAQYFSRAVPGSPGR